MTTFASRVAGIPCRIDVLRYRAGDPGFTSGPPDRCWEPEGDTFNFRVLDQRGRPAPWLERKLTDADTDRLLEEFLVLQRRQPYGLPLWLAAYR